MPRRILMSFPLILSSIFFPPLLSFYLARGLLHLFLYLPLLVSFGYLSSRSPSEEQLYCRSLGCIGSSYSKKDPPDCCADIINFCAHRRRSCVLVRYLGRRQWTLTLLPKWASRGWRVGGGPALVVREIFPPPTPRVKFALKSWAVRKKELLIKAILPRIGLLFALFQLQSKSGGSNGQEGSAIFASLRC